MTSFFETTFGPLELNIIDDALQAWRSHHALAKDDPDVSIAAEICINLFREGYRTLPDLQQAMARHKALNDMVVSH
ncbi:hypothetical protein [Agrobacterium sp.]|jgi:hypothetical protein|uniref:hypothetical protein n=1 Tax=Agrobacterium sp. TaxID=361 RepID=UPI0028A9E727|nr:hypothetical protein [Agrobacterium sp.]